MPKLETVARQKNADDEIIVQLFTVEDDFYSDKQKDLLDVVKENVQVAGIIFSWRFVTRNTIHARHIVIDTGWKISLDRGLDIFQHYDMSQTLALNNRLQKYRSCKSFEVTFVAAK